MNCRAVRKRCCCGWRRNLGCPFRNIHRASYVTEYAAALDSVADSVISRSMKTDRWATASELLSRRDELLLSGWDHVDSDALPGVVRDLARAAQGAGSCFSVSRID